MINIWTWYIIKNTQCSILCIKLKVEVNKKSRLFNNNLLFEYFLFIKLQNKFSKKYIYHKKHKFLPVLVSVSSELEKSANRFGLILRPLRLTTSLGDSSPCESKDSCFDVSFEAFPLPRFFFVSGVSCCRYYMHLLYMQIHIALLIEKWNK